MRTEQNLTDNLGPERHFNGFKKRAAVAKFRDYRLNYCAIFILVYFKAKHKKKLSCYNLNEMEQRWITQQGDKN